MAIEVTHKGKAYKFGFTRQTAANLEQAGFETEHLTSKPNQMIPLLVYYAATAFNPKIKHNLVDEIFNSMTDKSGFVSALAEEYVETVNSLFEEPAESESAGNATWKRI